MGHKWNSPRILAITLERLGNCDAICKHLLISFWSPTSWYPNTRGPWANRRNQSLEPRRMFGRWRVILTWLKLVTSGQVMSISSHISWPSNVEKIQLHEMSQAHWAQFLLWFHGSMSFNRKGYQDLKNQPQTPPRCGVVTYKHFVVLEHWLGMTRHLPDLENLHLTFTCQHVIICDLCPLPSENPSFCSDHFCVGRFPKVANRN